MSSSETLLLELQGQVLSAHLPEDEAGMKKEARRITGALSDGFVRLLKELRPPVVAEIGAHEGSFSERLKSLLTDARIIAIEANPEVWQSHRERLALAGVEYLWKCVSDKVGTLTLSVPIHPSSGPAMTMGSILADTAYVNFKSYEVESTTLDMLLGEDVDKPKALWVDVEGAVAQIIDGAARSLSSCQLLYVEMESRQRWAGQRTFVELVPVLRSFGLTPILRDVQRPWQFNTLFVNEGLLDRPEIREVCLATARSMGAQKLLPAPAPVANVPARPSVSAESPKKKKGKIGRAKRKQKGSGRGLKKDLNPAKMKASRRQRRSRRGRRKKALGETGPSRFWQGISRQWFSRASDVVTEKYAIGYTRFSVALYDRDAWNTKNTKDFDAYCSRLLDAKRLGVRSAIFLNSVLPTLARQAEAIDGFCHIIFYSSLLPREFRRRLDAAAEKYSWIDLRCIKPDGNLKIDVSSVFGRWPLKGTTVYAGYRWDDDDFISENYVKRLSEFIGLADVGRCVSFSRGFQGFFNQSKMKLENLRHFSFPMNAYGLAYIGLYDGAKKELLSKYSFPQGPHHLVDQLVPTILDGVEPMWFRCFTGENDSNLGMPHRAAAVQLARYPEATSEEVVRAVPSVAPWL